MIISLLLKSDRLNCELFKLCRLRAWSCKKNLLDVTDDDLGRMELNPVLWDLSSSKLDK